MRLCLQTKIQQGIVSTLSSASSKYLLLAATGWRRAPFLLGLGGLHIAHPARAYAVAASLPLDDTGMAQG